MAATREQSGASTGGEGTAQARAAILAALARFRTASAAGSLAALDQIWAPDVPAAHTFGAEPLPTAAALCSQVFRRSSGAIGPLLAADVYVLEDTAWVLAAEGSEAAWTPAVYQFLQLEGDWRLLARFLATTDQPAPRQRGPVRDAAGGAPAVHDGTTAAVAPSLAGARSVVERYYLARASGDWVTGNALWARVRWAFKATLASDSEAGLVEPPVSLAIEGYEAIAASERALWRPGTELAGPQAMEVWGSDEFAWCAALERTREETFGGRVAIHFLVRLRARGWLLAARVQLHG